MTRRPFASSFRRSGNRNVTSVSSSSDNNIRSSGNRRNVTSVSASASVSSSGNNIRNSGGNSDPHGDEKHSSNLLKQILMSQQNRDKRCSDYNLGQRIARNAKMDMDREDVNIQRAKADLQQLSDIFVSSSVELHLAMDLVRKGEYQGRVRVLHGLRGTVIEQLHDIAEVENFPLL